MRGERSWTHEVLSASARGEPSPELLARGTAADWDALFAAASAHGVTGWVARSVRSVGGVPQERQLRLQGAALTIAQNHARGLEAARATLSILNRGGETLVLKGPALAERYYRDPTLRPYGDVDLYVHPGFFRGAVELLEGAGYSLKDRNWDFIAGDLRGQLHFGAPSGGVIELHWHVVNSGRQRKTLRMARDELIRDAVPGELAGERCLALSPGDELAHLCLHAALHGCNRLIWLLDIRMLVERGTVDWDGAARRLERWRFGPGGYLVLRLAAELTGAPIPLEQLGALRAKGFTRTTFNRLVDAWDLADATRGAQVRELFFATAGSGVGARLGLATDVVVPAVGQRSTRPETGWGQKLLRVTVGSVARVRSKLAGEVSDYAEYRSQGDEKTGRNAFFDAIESAPGAEGG